MSKRKKEDSVFEKYKLAIQARNFHYDQFSKWGTYFYLAIGALFIAYYTISPDKTRIPSFSIPLLGYVCSIIWYLSSKGYYFWSLNFIKVINHYENHLLEWSSTERIYTMFAHNDYESQNNIDNLILPHKSANFSTSQLSLWFAYLIAFSWGIIFLSTIIGEQENPCFYFVVITADIVIISVSAIILNKLSESDISKLHKI